MQYHNFFNYQATNNLHSITYSHIKVIQLKKMCKYCASFVNSCQIVFCSPMMLKMCAFMSSSKFQLYKLISFMIAII